MLKQIDISGFRNLQNIQLHTGPLNVLVGSNSCGKSSVLHAIQFAVSISQSLDRDESLSWHEDTANGHLSPEELMFRPQADLLALGRNCSLSENPTQALKIGFTEAGGNFTEFKITASGKRDLKVALTGQDLFTTKLRPLSPPYSVLVPGLAGLAVEETHLGQGAVRRAAIRGDANRVFRNVFRLLRSSNDAMDLFLDDLHQIFPKTGFRLLSDVDYDDLIHLAVIATEDGPLLPIDAVGTGLLQAIQILAYVHLYNPALILLDEPDAHLHPQNQQLIARLLLRLCEERAKQIILATHSRHLVRALEEAAKFHWLRGGSVVPDHEYEVINVLLDLGALDRGDKLAAGLTKCVVLTEDAKTHALESLLIANGFHMDEVEVWSYRGCTNVGTLEALCRFILTHTPTVKILVHRDRDYLVSAEIAKYRNRIAAISPQISVFITEGTDVESAFLNVAHLKTCVPEKTKRALKVALDEASKASHKKSIEKYINNRLTAVERKSGRRKVNPGRIANACQTTYERSPTRYRHGKTVLGEIRSALQKDLGRNINLCVPSDALVKADLKEMANTLWVEETTCILTK
jgi:energy-coupling factor transporter ATP-binding protein EcfA2